MNLLPRQRPRPCSHMWITSDEKRDHVTVGVDVFFFTYCIIPPKLGRTPLGGAKEPRRRFSYLTALMSQGSAALLALAAPQRSCPAMVAAGAGAKLRH